jgi:antagonist of KipI
MSLEILRTGLQTTIQDLGRFGAAHLGISASGASDHLAMRIGNLMVGNPENTPVIEMTLTGDTVLFHSNAFVALVGSKFKINLDEKPFPFWMGAYISAGQVLTIGPTLKGARCYLCVRGGLQVKNIINSASTHLTSRIGGLNGSILKKGDKIAFGNLDKVIQPIKNIKNYPDTDITTVRVTKGLQWDWFDNQNRKLFFQKAYQVSTLSNRMGLRLSGESIHSYKGNEIITEGMPLGAIQIPGNGQPILSFVEHQTTGGYPKLANVISADLYKVGQLKPGDQFEFQLIGFPEAEKARLEQENYILSLKAHCS